MSGRFWVRLLPLRMQMKGVRKYQQTCATDPLSISMRSGLICLRISLIRAGVMPNWLRPSVFTAVGDAM